MIQLNVRKQQHLVVTEGGTVHPQVNTDHCTSTYTCVNFSLRLRQR